MNAIFALKLIFESSWALHAFPNDKDLDAVSDFEKLNFCFQYNLSLWTLKFFHVSAKFPDVRFYTKAIVWFIPSLGNRFNQLEDTICHSSFKFSKMPTSHQKNCPIHSKNFVQVCFIVLEDGSLKRIRVWEITAFF